MNPLSRLVIGFGFSMILVGCPTRDPQAVNGSCPVDAPCFLSVLAPQGATSAPGPFHIVAEVTGPHRIEGVGLVFSLNGAASIDLRLARLTSGNSLWGVPDLEADSVEPPEAMEAAQALARLQPGDQVTYILWAWDQMGNQTEWTGTGRQDAGSLSFTVVDGSSDDSVLDAGAGADSGGGVDGGDRPDDAGSGDPIGPDGGSVVVTPSDAG